MKQLLLVPYLLTSLVVYIGYAWHLGGMRLPGTLRVLIALWYGITIMGLAVALNAMEW